MESLQYSPETIENFPESAARTLHFRLGVPSHIQAVGDGHVALFLRSSSGEDFAGSLWMSVVSEAGEHTEVLLASVETLLSNGEEDIPAQELARRERMRVGTQGITAFSVDNSGNRATFTLNNALYVVDIARALQLLQEGNYQPINGTSCTLAIADIITIINPEVTPIIDPTLSPNGRYIAYSTGASLQVVDLAPSSDRSTFNANNGNAFVCLDIAGSNAYCCEQINNGNEHFSVGLADFIAGEEMDRDHGLWWSPDSQVLLYQTTDESPEPVWYIADPVHPEVESVGRKYPRALTSNAIVRLFAMPISEAGVLGETTEITWNSKEFEYLATASFTDSRSVILLVQDRLQQHSQVLTAVIDRKLCSDDPANNQSPCNASPVLYETRTEVVAEHSDECWIDLFPGAPTITSDGELLEILPDYETDTNRLCRNGVPFSPEGYQIRRVITVREHDVVAVASRDPRSFDVVIVGFDGAVTKLNEVSGVWSCSIRDHGYVLHGATMQSPYDTIQHIVGDTVANIASCAHDPNIVPNVEFCELGKDALQSAVIMPNSESPAGKALQRGESLPILLKPYGGPGHQLVVQSYKAWLDAQWWADQGFIVLTVDGHGTTGRGPRWDRAIYKSMADVTLQDQVNAVRAYGAMNPQADMSRVAMIGWSYGGFLSALAVLRAPEVIHAACAGAPPTDWTLYDTHYTERFLGLDEQDYVENSIIKDAESLSRPLLLIHGFADDNVTIAHTLRLSQALLAAGKEHSVLPLNGITHMTTNPTVAKNLLIFQRDFLRKALER